MARPTKQGIDYFPLDTQFDDKIEMYLLEKEANGLAVLVSLWQIIYSNEGYFTTNGDDLFLLIKKRINVDINEIKDCINVCLRRGIFDEKLHKKFGILTSKAIQKRYFEASKRKKEVRFNVNYIINGINVSENSINVGENTTNVKEELNLKEEVKERWNLFALENELSAIKKLSDIRKKHLEKRLKEKEFNFEIILQKIKESSFLLGENEKKWKIDFDFIISSENNYLKILENKYKNEKGQKIREL